MVAVGEGGPEPAAADLAMIVAAHGRDELHWLRRALEADVRYVGLVASERRGAGVLADLRSDGVGEEALARIDVPAGVAIGSLTPGEIALSILARVVEARRSGEPLPAAQQITDPVCGMAVVPGPQTPSLKRDGETYLLLLRGLQDEVRACLRRRLSIGASTAARLGYRLGGRPGPRRRRLEAARDSRSSCCRSATGRCSAMWSRSTRLRLRPADRRHRRCRRRGARRRST